MKKVINAVSGLGSAAMGFIIIWTMVIGSWIIYAVIEKDAEISVAAGSIITAFLALPYTFAKMINDRFPRTESKDDRTTDE